MTDAQFLRLNKIKPCDFPEVAAEPEIESVPIDMYNAVLRAYARLDAECRLVYQERQREAARNRRAFILASVIAGVLAVVAFWGWMK